MRKSQNVVLFGLSETLSEQPSAGSARSARMPKSIDIDRQELCIWNSTFSLKRFETFSEQTFRKALFPNNLNSNINKHCSLSYNNLFFENLLPLWHPAIIRVHIFNDKKFANQSKSSRRLYIYLFILSKKKTYSVHN